MVLEKGYPRITHRNTLTSGEVASLLNVHINTVRKWQNQGYLKGYRIGPRGDKRFRLEEIVSFLYGLKIVLNGLIHEPKNT